MKKIVGQINYDTDKADYVCGRSNGYCASDFKFREQDLYRTSKGRWFIHHKGGAMTDMAQQHGTSRSYGEDIQPLSHHEAYRFMEACNSNAAIYKYYASNVEDA